MTRPQFGRRTRRFLYTAAHIAVLVYVLQVIAIDHWHANPADVIGLEGSQTHVLHCHGDVGGCADGAASLVGSMADVQLAPAAPAARPVIETVSSVTIVQPFLALPDQPPQA